MTIEVGGARVSIAVEALKFTFPSGWLAHKYDDWSFYRNQFRTIRNGIKAVDLVILDPATRTAWFVEVKDYRMHPRTKPSEIGDEVAQKVFDTLAALLPAQTNANDGQQQKMAEAVLRSKKLRVVFHLEQPHKHSKLRPRAFNPADVMQKLRIRLKPVDAHPGVSERATMRSLRWTVR